MSKLDWYPLQSFPSGSTKAGDTFQAGIDFISASDKSGILLKICFKVPNDWKLNQFPENFELLISEISQQSQFVRRHELWKSTCFECFFKEQNSEEYFEVNVSPVIGWNLYHFDSYRNPQPPTEAEQFQLKSLQVQNNNIEIIVSGSWKSKTKYLFSLTSVIDFISSGVSYFAVSHHKAKPDFHAQDTYTIERECP